MISDITLGQFFPGFSVIHKLDPRTKILLSILFIVSIFVANNIAAFLLLTMVVVITISLRNKANKLYSYFHSTH